MIAIMSDAVTFADKPTLTGELVLLRPVTAADVPGLAAMVADPETARLTGTRPPAEPADLQQLERWYASRAEHHDRLDLAIIERATGRYAGEAVLNKLDPDNRSCAFRIALAGPHVFGRGLGTEATRLVLGHAFETAGLHRVELEVYDFNPRARHVYAKVGFVHEGIRRQALHWDGTWVDAHLMAMLHDDWVRATTGGGAPA
jgi:RimJ/RimL family protein N-acetyltransferase